MEQTELKLDSITFESNIPKKTINEERIKDIISKLISDDFQMMQEDDMLFQIIKYTKCDKSKASDIFERMNELGLDICFSNDYGYSISRFSNMRGYISDSDLEQMNKIILEKVRKENPKKAKFMEEHGVDKSTWSYEEKDEYEYELDG